MLVKKMLGETVRKRLLRTARRPGTASKLLAVVLLLTGGLLLMRTMRRARKRNFSPVPQPFHHLRESFSYRAPMEKVFGYWTSFSDFPRNFSEVAWVHETGPSQFRFGLIGPTGESGIWEVIVTRLVPNQYLEWYSTSKSKIQCSGRARFRSRPDGTHVYFEIESGPGLAWMVEGMERFVKEGLPAWLEADLPEETESKPA